MMNENSGDSRVMNRAVDEVEDKLFLMLWLATFVQAFLIVWDTVIQFRVSEMGLAWLGPLTWTWAQKVHAVEVTTMIYLIYQLAYMGKKEFLRWSKGVGVITPGGNIGLDDAEVARRVRRGDVAVVFWGILLVACGLALGLGLISAMPGQLIFTAAQVTGLYAFAAASKQNKKNKDRAALLRAPGAQNLSADPSALPRFAAASPGPARSVSRTRVEPAEYMQRIVDLLSKRGPLGAGDIASELGISRSRTGQLLTGMTGQGAVLKVGSGPATTYKSSR